ncbi:hypothetical protein [Ideonella sp.]|uniref:hypothetical protein n=1 Tax=Ideonella sp. TaxID=1929293 RepID=UPI0035B420A0
MNLRHFLAAAALTAVSATSFAQAAPTPVPPSVPTTEPVPRGTNTPVINKHEANQHDRIVAGKQSGEITKREAQRLHAEQKAVDRAQNKAAADGSVSTQERQHIRRMQHRADKDIYRQKHDGATKPATPSVPTNPKPVQ